MANKVFPNAVVEWSPNGVGFFDNGYKTAETLAEAATFLPGRNLLVALSRRTAFIRAYRVPNTSRAEVGRILDVQIGQLFPIPSSEVSYDFHLTDDVDQEGRLAIVAAVRSSDLVAMFDQARLAGLNVVQVVPAALGSALLAKQLGQPSGAVVQRLADGLAIDIVSNGELRYSRLTPVPESALNIEAEVSRTFAAAVLPCCPTIAAGGLVLPEADATTDRWSIEYLLGASLDIHIQTPAQRAAIELVETRRRTRLALLIFLASLLVLTFAYFRWSDAAALRAKSEATWTREIAQAKRIRDENIKTSSALVDMQGKLQRAFAPAQGIGDVVTIASNAVPSGIWLTGISLERGKALSIRGTAKTSELVAQYQQALIADPRFRDVTLVFATVSKIDEIPVYQFSISAFPVGNLPLVDPDAGKKKKATTTTGAK